MTPEEKEVELVNQAYQEALIQLGLKVVGESLNEWAAVSIGNAASITKYTIAATSLILLYRSRARMLSVKHTQLIRALLTGSTIDDPDVPASKKLGDLRQSFYDEIMSWDVPKPRKAKALPDDTIITVEKIPRLDDRIADRVQWTDAEIDTTFEKLLKEHLDKKMESLPDREKSPEKFEEKSSQLDLDTGARITSAAERVALNGARDNDADVIQFDRKALGWVRVHDPAKADHPCGWCSMLMTRGFLSGGIYTSERKAVYDSDGEKYHTNCHCIAEKVYRKSQLNSPRFDEHRKLAREYRKFTAIYGKSGDELRHAWDKYIRTTTKVSPNEGSHTHSASQAEAA